MHGTLTPLDLAKSSATYRNNLSVINDAVESFVETGIARIQDLDYSHLGNSNWTEKSKFWRQNKRTIAGHQQVRSFVKKIARDLKRPIITAEMDGWQGQKVTVTIRYLKRNDVIMSPFHLLNDDIHSPVRVRRDTKNWYVHFHGPAGRQLFEKWYEQYPTVPEYRHALKLPPLAPDLKLAA
jgi:hypothetical protein